MSSKIGLLHNYSITIDSFFKTALYIAPMIVKGNLPQILLYFSCILEKKDLKKWSVFIVFPHQWKIMSQLFHMIEFQSDCFLFLFTKRQKFYSTNEKKWGTILTWNVWNNREIRSFWIIALLVFFYGSIFRVSLSFSVKFQQSG